MDDKIYPILILTDQNDNTLYLMEDPKNGYFIQINGSKKLNKGWDWEGAHETVNNLCKFDIKQFINLLKT